MAERLLQYIRLDLLEGPDRECVGVEDDLLAPGMLDSLGVVQLLAFIESYFEITVPPEGVTRGHFRSVSSLAQYLQTLRSVR